uniref:Aquaporin 8a, tandem duplicate 1 n=1 Tax=Knipowitschia caucasica TaxID=637954 RepID=A0AAV2L9U2_KNICA
MSLPLVLPYILSQLLGGITGAGLVKVMFSAVEYQAGVGGAFTPDPMANDLGKITLAELVMTMFLTTTVTMGAVNKKTSSQLAPFCIGLTVTANILAGGGLSGACMNPARAFGPAVLANRWDYHWIYWVGPMCGALSTVIYVRY